MLPTSLGETHLLEAGSGDTVCVYLPGTDFNGATSLGLLGHLAERCLVVCPDLPGQPGLSSSTRPRPEVAGYGRWLDEVVESVRTRHPDGRLVVAGHSRGAAVALSATTEVDSLALVAPAGLVGVRPGPAILRVAVPWVLRPTAARSRALLELMSGPESIPGADLTDWLTLAATDTRTTGAPGPLPDSVVSRWRHRPVSVLVGEHDCFFPPGRIAPSARRRLGVETEVLKGLGHLAVEEAPGLVAERLLGAVTSS